MTRKKIKIEEQEPTVWPSRAVADDLVDRFMSMSELERSKKKEPTVYPSRAKEEKLIERFMGEPELERSQEKVSHEGYLKEMLAAAQELVAEHKKCNRELEAYHLVTQIQRGAEEAAKIVWFMLEKRDVIDRRRQMLMEGGNGGSVTGSGTSGGGPVEKPARDGSA